MNRIIIRAGMTCLIFIFAVITLAVPGYCAEQGKAIAKLTSFSGTVLIKSQGEWGVEPEEGMPLYSDDKIVTRMGIATITFDDGAVMDIKANSNLLIRETEDSTGLAGSIGAVKRRLRLLVGKMLFRSGKDTRTSTTLETTTMVCGLRGTAGTLSIDAAGVTYLQFTEGGGDTVGNFIAGIAPDVPAELAELNEAQRAAIVAATAAQQAKQAALKLASGEMTDKEAQMAVVEAAKAAAEEAKAAAESMLNSPDGNIREEAGAVIDIAEQAVETAQEAIDNFMSGGDDEAVLGDAYGVLGDALTRLVYNPALQGNEDSILLSGDLVPPAVEMISYPSAFNNLTGAVFTFNVDEYVGYYYILDGGTLSGTGYAEPGEASLTLSDLTEGPHILELVVLDAGGNETSQEFSWVTDYTAPVVALSVAPGETATLQAFLNNIELGEVSYLFTDASTGQVIPPYGFEDGAYSVNVTATDQAGNSSTTTFTFELVNLALLGDVLGSGSVITGSAEGMASMVYGIDSGGWETDLTGEWSGTHSGALSLTSGGSVESDYWLSLTSGAVDDAGAATGTTEIYFINETSVSRGTGTFTGAFSDDYTWTGTNSGYDLVTMPFDMSGIWASDAFYYYGYGISDSGSDGYAGLIANGTDFDFFAMGDYTNSYASSYTGPYLWLAAIGGEEDEYPYDYKNHALMGGVWDNDGLKGFLAAMYDTDEIAGIIYTDVQGDYYTLDQSGYYGMWKIEGTVEPVEIAEIGSGYYKAEETPYEASFLFADTIDSPNGIYLDTGSYNITENGVSLTEYILTDTEDFYMAYGVWGVRLEGYYDYNYYSQGSDWKLSIGGNEIDSGPLSVLMEIGSGDESSTWDSTAGDISAYVAGSWIDLDDAITGVVGGRLAGTFDADYSAWQGLAVGSLLDTKKFLEMVENNPSGLAALDIPCVEIGNTRLEGGYTPPVGGSEIWNVTMDNVTFFAYSTGADPKIWATSDVSGTFTTAPSVDQTAALSSTSGSSFSANFTIESWGTDSWGASIDGVGAITRTDTSGTSNVAIEGGAAGSYTITDDPQTGAGEFLGAASGVTREYVP